ncbi:M1 family metallopeptidase [Algoriphagus zhangzhouensis]|uniref:Aminopeptidase N n=1 Tax=Algoriphagus zhangzhouensis TaxID=1073327 RepID=A0A1M7Z5U7_9BACT|nr:M1 family metallopeptidase [Algoriphagus zhangzhouensis]TDY48827.1 peptidase M1-like protein [Algoriphagus zhangzhouensis]SHO60016.1 Peptidase family M1 [Algoriphagus zhangzhouensis]
MLVYIFPQKFLKNFLILVLGFVSSASFAWTDSYPKNPKVDVLNYQFKIELSDDTDVIKCEVLVDVKYLGEGVENLRLDLVKASEALENKGMIISSIQSDGVDLYYIHEGDELQIKLPSRSQTNEEKQYKIVYSGIPASGLKIAENKYGDRTFFSDNWPDKGRNWLAIVDHPYDKATSEFIVTAPSHYQVVSNGLKIEETDLGDGNRITHWKQSVPIASWLYVLGVARFAMQEVDQFDHKSIQTWVYYQDREKGFYDFAVPTKQVLEYYSDYIGPFSYEKLANIQSNSVSGGMEAASAILYSESSVVGDRNTRWRNVIIHEIAHQWFGNSVTEYDWDDVWLSEGFATYFTLLFREHAYGRDDFLEGLANSKRTVDSFHEKNPEYRIVHDNLSDMSKVVSSHTYQKGSWILHMLRGVVGTENFWKGIRAYYAKYQNKNATTDDFRFEMEKASGQDLKWFFEQWLYKPGTLKLEGIWTYDPALKLVKIDLDQVQNDGSQFRMPIQVAIKTKDKIEEKLILIDSKENQFGIQVDEEPEEIILDPKTWVLMDWKLEKGN